MEKEELILTLNIGGKWILSKPTREEHINIFEEKNNELNDKDWIEDYILFYSDED